MHWDDVRVLLALFRAPKLADAAASLGLDASTLSRRLARLEADAGAKLFARTRDGLRPTAVAERLRAAAESMEAGAATLAHSLRRGTDEATGTVRLATTEAFAHILVVEGLLQVCDEHPNLTLELLSDNRAVDLVRGEAELALRLSALRQPSLRARCIGKTRVALFASERYLTEHPVRGGSLKGHRVLLPSGELGGLPEARWLASRPGVHVALQSNSMPALVAAAVAANGIVPLPQGWGESQRTLRRVATLEQIPERKVWLVTHEAAAARPGVIAVSEHVTRIFGRLFASPQT